MLQMIATNTAIRSLLRRIGVLGFAKRIANLSSRSYEDKFAQALLAEIRSGDVVWDVGANVGYYTSKFAEIVGAHGKVLAFEPVQSSFRRMESAVKPFGAAVVRPFHLALGSKPDRLSVQVTSEQDGVTNSLARTAGEGQNEIITVAAGDDVIAGGAPSPDVVKIDVEAYEEEVIFGLRKLWQSGTCRAVFVEVHFQQLELRGLRRAPDRLESFFRDCGYGVRWLDASHFQARKSSN
jgi:FkbM family methyltransferase